MLTFPFYITLCFQLSINLFITKLYIFCLASIDMIKIKNGMLRNSFGGAVSFLSLQHFIAPKREH